MAERQQILAKKWKKLHFNRVNNNPTNTKMEGGWETPALVMYGL